MLPKENRLKKEKDFKRVFKKGKTFSSRIYKIKYNRNTLGVLRFGFVVSAKVSKKATERNRLKRRLREIIRLNLSKIQQGWDVVVAAKPDALLCDYQELKETLLWAFKKTNLLK